jgi:HSP20 family protein
MHGRRNKQMIRRYDPFNLFDRMTDAFDLTKELDNFYDITNEMSRNNVWGLYEGDWSPRLDMFEDENAYFMKVDVPGVKEKDLELSVTNDVLTLKGKRDQGTEEDESKKKGRRYQREERMYGIFQRTVPLPMPVDSDKVDAKLRDGVLYITLPKKEETKPKKISVSTS